MQTSERAELQGQDIICFANDWDSDPLSKKHIMTRLARRNRVLWVNSIGTRNPQASARDLRRAAAKLRQSFQRYKQVAENIFVFSPIAIPFHGSRFARRVNRHWLSWSVRRVSKQLGFRDPITWTFLPSTAGVAGNLGERMVIYHCVDEFSEFTGTDKRALLDMERKLLRRADLVFVSSQPLLETKRIHNPNAFLVTHGVDVKHFRSACDPACDLTTTVPQDIAHLEGPVIGFFGLVADWVDLKLIRQLALARPRWSLVLIGKCDTDATILEGLPNVHLLGKRDYRDLPAYCKGFSVGVLPFVINTLTLASNPLKLREYLAAGLPVVATAIPEAGRLRGLVRTAATDGEFLEQIDALLAGGRCGPQMTISREMDCESWDEKVSELSGLASETMIRAGVKTAESTSAGRVPGLCSGS
jgi:glycosyltransferase involved in cell wall biosynthesis